MEVGQLNKLKIGAIIQARLTSSRLPGKVLMNLPMNGTTRMIDQIIFRCKRAKKLDDVILATSIDKSDNELVKYIGTATNVHRGSLDNVLDRYFECASHYGLNHIVRITGDNPCIDPYIIDQTIEFHLISGNDYTKTIGLPIGLNIEIISFKAIEIANKEAKTSYQKEHVTCYIIDNLQKFKLGSLNFNEYEAITNFRLTVDYPSDFSLVNLIYNSLGDKFSLSDINNLILKYSWLQEINDNFQKKEFASLNEELKTAIIQLEKIELKNASQILKNTLE